MTPGRILVEYFEGFLGLEDAIRRSGLSVRDFHRRIDRIHDRDARLRRQLWGD